MLTVWRCYRRSLSDIRRIPSDGSFLSITKPYCFAGLLKISRRWTIAKARQLGQRRSGPVPRGLFFPVVLVQLPVKRFAADAEGAGSVRLVAVGVVERSFDRLALDLFHRRRHGHFKCRRASLARSLRPFNLDAVAFAQGNLADRLRQVFQLNLPAGSDDHRALDCVFEFANIAGPLVSD